MKGSNKIVQFLHENITWKRSLDYFMQENNFLKTRLSEMVDRESDKIFIANAEEFQNRFLLKDEYILDIGNDIKGQEKNLQLIFTGEEEPGPKACRQQQKLRNEMSYLEKECFRLKNEFNKYLVSII